MLGIAKVILAKHSKYWSQDISYFLIIAIIMLRMLTQDINSIERFCKDFKTPDYNWYLGFRPLILRLEEVTLPYNIKKLFLVDQGTPSRSDSLIP